MNKLFATLCSILTIPIFLTLLNSEVRAQKIDPLPLNERRFNLTVKQGDFGDILVLLARKHNVPLGFEVTSGQEDPNCKKRISATFENAEIGDIMNHLVSICPSYSWSVVGEAVNVFPVYKEESFLDAEIVSLIVQDKKSEEILDALFDLDEIKKELKKKGLQRDTTTSSLQGDSEYLSKYSFSLSKRPFGI